MFNFDIIILYIEGIANKISNTTKHHENQTVNFMDIDSQWKTSVDTNPDSTFTTAFSQDVTLSDFFQRPIKVDSTTWTPSSVTPFYVAINPWTLFFENPRVANRISNYNLLHCNLHVKVMINGNGFYFGRLIANYVPLKNYDTLTPTNGLESIVRIGASQRLHFYIDPTNSQGGEMILPYLWQYDAINIPNRDYDNMGMFYIHEFNPLQHANGSTDSISVTTYVWAENVKVSCPTSVPIYGLTNQADEYSMSPVSSTATALARSAGQLTTIPYIAPYAKATQMAMEIISGVAKAFGLSRPAIIDNVMPMIPQFIGPIANCDRGDNVTKLTVDSKQELSIDPRTLGLGSQDEMAIQYIASKETFLTTFSWSPSDITSTFKWNAKVAPIYAVTSSGLTYIPACTFASLPFKYWRGIMRYRFQIVSSNFHKGRLKIVYDPGYILSDETNILYSHIVDIGDKKEFTLDIGWANEKSYLRVYSIASASSTFSTTKFTSVNRDYCNGTIGVYVLNELTSPSPDASTKSVEVNVFVSLHESSYGAPDAENIRNMQYLPNTYIASQSEECDLAGDANAPTNISSDAEVCMMHDQSNHLTDIYFGEEIKSFRQMLKRYDFHSGMLLPTPTALNTWNTWLSDFPTFKGYTANGINSTPDTPQNICANTLLNYLAPAFCCVRGSMRYKYLFTTSDVTGITHITVTRENTENAGFGTSNTNLNTILPDTFAENVRYVTTKHFQGSHMTPIRNQPSLEVEIPFYSNARFLCPKDPSLTSSNYSLGRYSHRIYVTRQANAIMTFRRMVSVGEDFTLNMFQGCPPFYT